MIFLCRIVKKAQWSPCCQGGITRAVIYAPSAKIYHAGPGDLTGAPLAGGAHFLRARLLIL